MPNVDPKRCLLCRFKKICQYRDNEGANLSSLVATEDGDCRMFGAEDDVIKQDEEAENS